MGEYFKPWRRKLFVVVLGSFLLGMIFCGILFRILSTTPNGKREIATNAPPQSQKVLTETSIPPEVQRMLGIPKVQGENGELSYSPDVRVGSAEGTTKTVHLEDDQMAGFIIDMIVDEFRKTSEWPEQNLKFTEPETSVHYNLKPSEVVTPTKDGAKGAKAIFITDKKQVETLITVREVGKDKYELKVGSETMAFSFGEMPCCPPFAPGVVISVLGAKLITAAVQDQFLFR